jgi:hypothetical protein
VPLAIWPCAQTSAQYQRAGRYLPGSSSHPGKMLPELAHRLVAEYCPPGGLVADPMCGIGTTLVEAATLHRRAVGVELEPAGSNSPTPTSPTRSRPSRPPSPRFVTVTPADCPTCWRMWLGRVDLVVTSPQCWALVARPGVW